MVDLRLQYEFVETIWLAGCWLVAGVSHTNQEVGIDRPQAMRDRERVKQRLTPINGRLVPNKQLRQCHRNSQSQASKRKPSKQIINAKMWRSQQICKSWAAGRESSTTQYAKWRTSTRILAATPMAILVVPALVLTKSITYWRSSVNRPLSSHLRTRQDGRMKVA